MTHNFTARGPSRFALLIAAPLLMLGCRATEKNQIDAPADRPQQPSTDYIGVDKRAAPPEKNAMNQADPKNVPRELMNRMIADTAAKSGVLADDIELVRAEHVVWSDSSLGCPQPNMGYSQVLSPGYWVILRAGGEEYDYRASERGSGFMRCTGATKRAPIRYPSDT